MTATGSAADYTKGDESTTDTGTYSAGVDESTTGSGPSEEMTDEPWDESKTMPSGEMTDGPWDFRLPSGEIIRSVF